MRIRSEVFEPKGKLKKEIKWAQSVQSHEPKSTIINRHTVISHSVNLSDPTIWWWHPQRPKVEAYLSVQAIWLKCRPKVKHWRPAGNVSLFQTLVEVRNPKVKLWILKCNVMMFQTLVEVKFQKSSSSKLLSSPVLSQHVDDRRRKCRTSKMKFWRSCAPDRRLGCSCSVLWYMWMLLISYLQFSKKRCKMTRNFLSSGRNGGEIGMCEWSLIICDRLPKKSGFGTSSVLTSVHWKNR